MSADVGEEPSQHGGEFRLLGRCESIEELLLAAQDFTDDPLDEFEAVGRERDDDRSGVARRRLPTDPSRTLGLHEPLRHRTGRDQGSVGELGRRQAVRRPGAAERGEQVECRRVGAELGQQSGSVAIEQPGDSPDARRLARAGST